MKKLPLLLCAILSALILWDYFNFRQEGLPVDVSVMPVDQNSVVSARFSDIGLSVDCYLQKDAFIVLPFSAKTYFWKRLQIDIGQLRGVKSVEIFYREAGHKGFEKMAKKFVRAGGEQSFTWFIPPGEYNQLRIDFDGYLQRSELVISSIQLKKYSVFFFYEVYLYFLAVLILGLFVLPGSLLYAISAKKHEEAPRNNLLYLFTNSLIFYLILYLVETAALKFKIPSTTTVTLAFFLLLVLLFAALVIRRRTSFLVSVLKKERKTYVASIILVLICCMFISRFSEAPFTEDSVNFKNLGGMTIFSEFNAHDNQFQYINGKAIADDEPFSKYYRQRKLIYNVQDRGMLPGVIYSVFRTVFTTFNAYVGGSFLTYTLVGLCMNVMVLFPLVVLFRRYCDAKYQNIFLVLLCLNTFVFPNFYYTWFKFSGAALFISGLLILLDSRKSAGGWMAAGFMFGLASGMHAGNALSIPLVFLWFVWLAVVEFGFWSRQVFVFPVALAMMFIITNLPWSIVKALHFPDNHALIRQHYFPGGQGSTLAAVVRNFFETHPFKTQLSIRLGNVTGSLRYDEFVGCLQLIGEKGVNTFIRVYNNNQFFYFSFSVLPLIFSGAVSRLSSVFLPAESVGPGNRSEGSQTGDKEALALFAISLLTVLGLIFMAYTDYSDHNHALPTGTILVIHTLLLAWTINSGIIGQVLLAVYAIFSAWRMIAYSLLFIFV